MKHLGPRFDVHTGGIDNVFPHHEDEIAQSAPIVGGPPARVWVHGEFLQVGGQKMAKSAGNIERIADVAERGIDPLAFRYLCLTSRYRHKLEYTDESLGGGGCRARSRCGRVCGARSRRRPTGRGRRRPSSGRVPRAARPLGTADGVAGNGDGERRPLSRPGRTRPAAPLSAGRARAPRPVRRGDRRRPRPADGARGRPRDAPARDLPPTSGAGSSSTPTSSSGWTSIGPPRTSRSAPRRPNAPGDVDRLADERAAARAAARLRPADAHPDAAGRARLRGDRRSGRPDRPAAAEPRRRYVARSRRDPNRSMIR